MKVCQTFVKSPIPILLDAVGHRYGIRPSQLYEGYLEDFQIDWLCFESWKKNEEKMIQKEQAKQRSQVVRRKR